MKKVLIITYYWIPSGGAGVQRWIKFTKYLRDFGWEPVIYTPENPEYPSEDYSFEKDIPSDVQIIKTPIWEPYNIYRNLTGKKNERINAGFISENKKPSWKDKLSIAIRGNFLIPDPRRFWIQPSVRYLTNYLTENPVDAVITTGPPHSMHMIGLKLKKIFPSLPWIADFRDPWTNIDFYKDLNLTFIADKIHHYFERQVVAHTDCLVTVSQGWLEGFLKLHPKKGKVIQNGFDSDDIYQGAINIDSKFSISHIGSLNAARNPTVLWTALSELCFENESLKNDLEIQLIGKVDFSVLDDLRKFGLMEYLNRIDYLPHNEAIAKQQSSQVLLLLINKSQNASGILTGKFYEYMAAKRPILAIGPTDGDAATVLNETSVGKIVGFEDLGATKHAVLEYYELFQKKSLFVKSTSVERFSRRSLTCELADLLNSLCGKE